MNFSTEYEITSLYMEAIRKLGTPGSWSQRGGYTLRSVNFDHLRQISTSAALVLTAEISKWDDSGRQRLTPRVGRWDREILFRFHELGFFDLFVRKPQYDTGFLGKPESSTRIVRYIKGETGDNSKTRILKSKLKDIIGEDIKKWVFLNSGLGEAITNVSHHAYPQKSSNESKNWYLSGAFNRVTKELKIVFYDQGIGIPKSLPESAIWELALKYLSRFDRVDRMRDETLVKAAVELDRTRTGDSDRGKGLQDLLEFIRQRGDGYLSIFSRRGLYIFSIKNGKENVRTENFARPVFGTLIIWKANINVS